MENEFNVSDGLFAPLRIFMVRAKKQKQVLYVLAEDVYISVEHKQMLVPVFSKCYLVKPKNGVYLEYWLTLVGGKQKVTLNFDSCKEIYSFEFKRVNEEGYEDYLKVSKYFGGLKIKEKNQVSINDDGNDAYEEIETAVSVLDKILPYSSYTLEELNEALDRAVSDEKYEKAANIRDEIDKR